jgi:hypothetical protein
MEVLTALEPRLVLAHDVAIRDVPVHDAMMHDVMRTIVERRRGSCAGARKRQAHAHDCDKNFLFDTQGEHSFFNATGICGLIAKDYECRAVNAF